jgi:clan AA aspartic protease
LAAFLQLKPRLIQLLRPFRLASQRIQAIVEAQQNGDHNMGHIYANLQLGNPRDSDIAPMQVRALADTGALMLCIPEHLALQLQLETVELREVTLADGRCVEVPYVGPVSVGFDKRRCFTGALVLGEEVLLGAVPMEDMDLVLNPARQSVTVNPASPNMPHSRVKRQQPHAVAAAV